MQNWKNGERKTASSHVVGPHGAMFASSIRHFSIFNFILPR